MRHGRVGLRHERSSRLVAASFGDVLCRVGMLQAPTTADSAREPNRLRASATWEVCAVHDRVGRLVVTTTRSGSNHVARTRLAPAPPWGRSRARRAARPAGAVAAHARAQMLAAALERGEVVGVSQPLGGAVQHRARHPGRVEHVRMRGRWVSTISTRGSAVSRSAFSRQGSSVQHPGIRHRAAVERHLHGCCSSLHQPCQHSRKIIGPRSLVEK